MIGLIFGDTDFPKEILKTVKRKNIDYLIIDLSKSKQFKKDKKSYSVSIGQFGKIINILRKNNCKKVLFAGKVNKPNFSKLKLDLKGIFYVPRIIKASKIGDVAILKEIIKILANKDSLPVVLHCTAGKDRTGVSTAFLLSILGVSRDVIEADYLLTNLDTERQADFIENTVGYPEGYDRKSMIAAAGVPEDALKDFLDGVESKWGSAVLYLKEIGVTKEQMDSIRNNFLE